MPAHQRLPYAYAYRGNSIRGALLTPLYLRSIIMCIAPLVNADSPSAMNAFTFFGYSALYSFQKTQPLLTNTCIRSLAEIKPLTRSDGELMKFLERDYHSFLFAARVLTFHYGCKCVHRSCIRVVEKSWHFCWFV